MPRTGRGGRRTGTPGKTYGNRTDLQTGPRPLPVKTAPGQEYGAAGQQAAAQRAVPMASGPAAPPPAAGPDHGALMQAVQQFSPTTPVVPMGAPSMRPAEPATAGMSSGPGPGPTPPPVASNPLLHGVALLNALGGAVSPEVKALRDSLAASQANMAAP